MASSPVLSPVSDWCGSVADAETDSLTAESGFEEQEVSSAGVEVTRFVSRFVDKVCTEGHVSHEHVR